MDIIFSAIVWLLIVGASALKKHYFFAVLCLWIGAYEYIGQFFYRYVDDNFIGINVHLLSASYVTENSISSYGILLNVFFITMALCYAAISIGNVDIRTESNAAIPQDRFIRLLLALFIFGCVSWYTGAGNIAQSDYYSEYARDIRESPTLSYGGMILVCAVCLFYNSILEMKRLSHRNLVYLVLIIASILPISYELFIAGRRASFTPSMLLIVFFIMYDKRVTRKKIAIIVMTAIFLALTSVQFVVRNINATMGLSFESIGHQFSELPLIHATSQVTFNVIDVESVSYGWHYLVAMLNSMPYFRMGDFIVEMFNMETWAYDSSVITPLGGLSMIADSILAFHIPGMLILSFAFAFIANFFHKQFVKLTHANALSSVAGLLYLPIGVMIIAGYRNGLSHTIKAVISFYILYMFIAYLPRLLRIGSSRY